MDIMIFFYYRISWNLSLARNITNTTDDDDDNDDDGDDDDAADHPFRIYIIKKTNKQLCLVSKHVKRRRHATK